MEISKAAKTYEQLLEYNYIFKVIKNRNNNLIELVFDFKKYYFYHLCGLHKLKDIYELRAKNIKDKEKIFDKIINGEYSNSLFENSFHYNEIKDRIECLEKLDYILDNSLSVFKYNSFQKGITVIDFDYLIKYTDKKGHQYYLTIVDKLDSNLYCGCSCFGRTLNADDYAKGHTQYYVLQKIKRNLITHEETELFIAPSYKKQLEEQNTGGMNIKKETMDFQNLSDLHIQQDGTIALSPNKTQFFKPFDFDEFLDNMVNDFKTKMASLMNAITKEKNLEPFSFDCMDKPKQRNKNNDVR